MRDAMHLLGQASLWLADVTRSALADHLMAEALKRSPVLPSEAPRNGT